MTTIGIITDLHLGGQGIGHWHNRLLYDHAEEVTRATIALLNRRSPDLVLVLGDVTQHGTLDELRLASRLFSEFRCPWHVLPGNHDRAAVQSGQFDAVFAEHALPPSLVINGAQIIGVRERAGGATGYEIDEEWSGTAIERTAFPLVIASHVPLLPEDHPGKYAGHLDRG